MATCTETIIQSIAEDLQDAQERCAWRGVIAASADPHGAKRRPTRSQAQHLRPLDMKSKKPRQVMECDTRPQYSTNRDEELAVAQGAPWRGPQPVRAPIGQDSDAPGPI